ncbi:LCP family protein [Pseudoflavonifractor sp.]|jgi:LCP family protein required for cell wall assembly|uniref:LCP family protein n=1 Tax=Pseudoflavonifractor sp. TaxID=1980281 RepID=UPI003D8F43FA
MKPSHSSPSNSPQAIARKVLKILYIILAVIAAIIVIFYCAYKLLAKEPTPAPPPSAASQPESSLPASQSPEASSSPSPDQQVSRTHERKPYCYTFLLVATDQVSGNTDTIMVLTYDTVNQTVGLVSIPRDTLVNAGSLRINSLYYKGIEELENCVSDLLGIPIDYHVIIDIEGFVELVDLLGGVEFDIPVHMSYDAPDQDLHIHFEPGLQHLTGEEALLVCRLRKNSDGTIPYPDSDIGRTRTQQQLLAAIAKKALANPQNLPSYVEIIADTVDTNLSFREMLWFVEPALGFDLENGLSTATLPGNGEVSYKGLDWLYQLYPEEVLDIVNTMLNPYTEPLELDELNIFEVE